MSRCFTQIKGCERGYTLAVWIWLGESHNRWLIDSGSSTNIVRDGAIGIEANENKLEVTIRMQLGTEEGSGRIWKNTEIGISVKEWFHLAVTVKKDDLMKVYINGGSPLTADSETYNPNPHLSTIMFLGGSAFGSLGEYFGDTALDELQMWTFVKNREEIKELQQGKNNKNTGSSSNKIQS